MIEYLIEHWVYLVVGIVFFELNLWYLSRSMRFSNQHIANVLSRSISAKVETVLTDIARLRYEYENMNEEFQKVNEKLIDQLVARNKMDARISEQVNETIAHEVEKANKFSSELYTLYEVQTASVNSSINDLLTHLRDVKKDSTQVINLQGQIIKLEQRIKDFNK